MSELRWILIGFGIVLLAGIYLWGRRGSAAVSEDVALRSGAEPLPQPRGFSDSRREPGLDAENDVSSYDEPSYEEDEEPEAPVRELERADDYEVTAARPVAPRTEARLTRTEPPRHIVKEVPAGSSEMLRPVPDFRRGRVETTLGSDSITEELHPEPEAEEPASIIAAPSSAPTLSSSDTPTARRPSGVRKILSLRLSLAPQKVEGAKLLEVLQEELLTHGKYEIFHRLHEGQTVFSIASMVEPGSFDPEKMGETLYPGVTLFAQLPGPVPGMHALNELVACARRLHQSLGGVLQDDRGVPLTVHRIERMRQEVRDFERPPSASTRSTTGKTEG